MDVGYGLQVPDEQPTDNQTTIESLEIVKKEGYLFDCVDFCVNEGSRVCILGENGSGKVGLVLYGLACESMMTNAIFLRKIEYLASHTGQTGKATRGDRPSCLRNKDWLL